MSHSARAMSGKDSPHRLGLSAARLIEVARRVASRFYDSAAVRTRVAEALVLDFHSDQRAVPDAD